MPTDSDSYPRLRGRKCDTFSNSVKRLPCKEGEKNRGDQMEKWRGHTSGTKNGFYPWIQRQEVGSFPKENKPTRKKRTYLVKKTWEAKPAAFGSSRMIRQVRRSKKLTHNSS